MNILNISLNKTGFERMIELLKVDKSFNNYTRLLINNKTIYQLTGSYFHDDRKQTYQGIPFIQDETLEYGEVIVLTQRM